MENKGQTAGLIMGLVMGIASLVIAVIIAFVIVSTLTGADLLSDNRPTITVLNEVGHVNATGYTLAGASADRLLSGSFTITGLVNRTSGDSALVTNATVSTAGVVTNASATNYNNASFNYTYILQTYEELSTSGLSGNFSSGIDNVSAQVPTVLLIAAIILVLTILAVLIGVWQRMRMGGGTSL